MIVSNEIDERQPTPKGSIDMELLTVVTALVATLTAFGLLAVNNGTDSRESMADDWARPASI
jgi:hypothetical protein